MNPDERFDQRLRAALEWQADEAARRLPSLERSVQQLAGRLGPEPRRRPSSIVGRARSGHGLQLVFGLVLLMLLLAAVLAVGALLQPKPPIQPPRFGFAGTCFGDQLEGAVLTVADDETSIVLYDDGSHITLQGTTGATRSEIFDTGGLERRLTDRGVELMLGRVAETLPEPGCRHLRSETGTGQLAIVSSTGLIELSWHPSNSGRRLTADEEAEAEALEQALAKPETWLPDEAFVERTPRQAAPERWLVFVELTPSGLAPGQDVPLEDGGVLQGSDPRYARVVLPEGQEPAEFGEQVAVRDGTSVRCGVLGTDDARRLSDSLDALPLAMHDDEALYTADLTSRVFIYIATAYPEEPDCAAAAKGQVAPDPTPEPLPATPGPEYDLAGIDPCDLIPADASMQLAGGGRLEPQPSSLSLGVSARACSVVTGAPLSPTMQHAVVTLYPMRVDLETAAALAVSVMGGGTVEETIASRPAWLNDCLAAALACRGSIAAWSGSFLLIIEFPGEFPGGPSIVTPTSGRAFVEAIVMGLPE